MNTSDGNDEPLPVKQEDLPEGVILRDHVVDGIQEYDQRLPFWWLCILFGVIGFSIVYWLGMDDRSFTGSEDAQLEHKLAEIETIRLANSIDINNNDLFWEMSANASIVSAGKKTFENQCATCHGKNLMGGIGFNLVDSEWIHGSKPSQIYVSIENGFPNKGMQPWGPILGQKRITEITAYILSKNDKEQMLAAAKADGTNTLPEPDMNQN